MRKSQKSGDGSQPNIPRLRRALLEYFDSVAGRRELPWRDEDADPYRVWVSEVMLQQTRAETVVPYYRRWLRRFPDLDSLAQAGEHEVLKAWEGLGYYRRARYLHRAARVVRERYGGQLPARPDELKALPGIGEYTAGAVASIAFGIPVPAVDGNTRRVLCRMLDQGDPSPSTLRRLAVSFVPYDRPGDFNQALMELGATICTPRNPDCEDCPVSDQCLAYERGTQEERPKRRKKKALPHFDIGTAVLVRADGKVLLSRRPAHGLLAGLWEFPGGIVRGDEAPAAAAIRAAQVSLAVIRECGRADTERAAGVCGNPDDSIRESAHERVRLGRSVPLGSIDHTFTHRRHTYHPFQFRMPDGMVARNGGSERPVGDAGTEVRWTSLADMSTFALPSAQWKIVGLLTEVNRP